MVRPFGSWPPWVLLMTRSPPCAFGVKCNCNSVKGKHELTIIPLYLIHLLSPSVFLWHTQKKKKMFYYPVQPGMISCMPTRVLSRRLRTRSWYWSWPNPGSGISLSPEFLYLLVLIMLMRVNNPSTTNKPTLSLSLSLTDDGLQWVASVAGCNRRRQGVWWWTWVGVNGYDFEFV